MQPPALVDQNPRSETPARVIDPPLSSLPSLRQPLNDGERRVLEWFIEILPIGWEIYVQPHLNGLRPDFVLLHPRCGIAVYEVKDWNLHGLDYFVDAEDRHRPRLMGCRDGKTFSLAPHDPVSAIDRYKREIHGLYVPSLPAGSGLGAIVAGVIFPSASTRDVEDLLNPLRWAKGHTEFPKLYPVIGAEFLERRDERALRTLLNSARRVDDRMNDRVATELRHWLVEPSFSRDQRVPLAQLMTPRQKSLCINKEGVRFRRVKGPAGSGKSLVLAGRAAELAMQGRRVLVLTFNITLINYLLDQAVQYAQSGAVRRQITALNFHYWCRRVAELAGKEREYKALWSESGEDDVEILRNKLPSAAALWAAALEEKCRWDAVLVDEGQDFLPAWWGAIRAALRSDGSGEAMLVADQQQNVYGVKPWTDMEMSGAGFRGPWGVLEVSHRMSPSLCQRAVDFVDRFQPDIDQHRPIPAQGELEYRTELRWLQIDPAAPAAAACFDALLDILSISDDDPVAVAELVCIVDREDIGLEIVRLLEGKRIRVLHTFGIGPTRSERDADGRRRKLAFFRGDARVKVTTIQSFKGWESRALVVHISKASNPTDLALAYAAITRLKQDDRGCFLTVVCSTPELREFGQTWQ